MNNILDHALRYAGIGWEVFPLYGIKDGVCTCWKKEKCGSNAGKHPLTSDGLLSATTDPLQIRKWFESGDNINIGVRTGEVSNLVVIDIDGDNDLNESDLPETVEQITGSGGRHLLYKYPKDGNKYKTMVRVIENVDSRADGGYIVAPPSMHLSGNKYEWECEHDPFNTEINDGPKSWLDRIKENKKRAESIQPSINIDYFPYNINEILSYIPSDNYDIWYQVGLALYRCDNGMDGFELFDWWSSGANNYDESAVKAKWKSFKNANTSNPILMGTVRRLAEEHGWTDTALAHGGNAANNIIQSFQKKEAEKIEEARKRNQKTSEIKKPNLIPDCNNLIAKISTFITDCSVFPQPDLSVAAAITLLGTICGQKYQTETGLRTNIYAVGLAESGCGKDHARKIINNIATDAGLNEFIGGDRIASGQGLINSVLEHPQKLFMLDEFGHFLESIGKNSNAFRRDIITTFMQFYSSANSTFRGTEYANRKENPRQDIIEPTVCIYGTSTHETFFNALSSSEAVDGTISRLIVVDAGSDRPKALRRPNLYKKNYEINSILKSIKESKVEGNNLAGLMNGGMKTTSTRVVEMTDSVKDLMYDFNEDSYKLSKDSASRSIYSRVGENAAKLALIHAIGKDYENPKIDLDSFEWARDFALYSANQLVKQIVDRVADNEIEKEIKKVLNIVKSNKKGISKSLLSRKCFFVKKRDFEEILARLIESEMIEEMIEKTKTKPKVLYFYKGE